MDTRQDEGTAAAGFAELKRCEITKEEKSSNQTVDRWALDLGAVGQYVRSRNSGTGPQKGKR